MRRQFTTRRFIGKLPAIGSVVALIVLAGLTIRSYWVFDQLVWMTPQTERSVWLNRGRLGFSADAAVDGAVFGDLPGFTHLAMPAAHRRDTMPERWADSYFERGGVGYLRRLDGVTDSRDWWVSMWWVLIAGGIAPACVAARAARRRRLRERGSCRRCGYDLRATPQRCPECGEVAEVARAAAN